LPHYFGTEYRNPIDCVKVCLSEGYVVAAMQICKECWCGDSFGKHGPAEASKCHSTIDEAWPALGLFGCGGAAVNSVYRVVPPHETVGVVVTAGGALDVQLDVRELEPELLGCYKDDTTQRDLPLVASASTRAARSSGHAPATCVAACMRHGLAHAALQAGGECWCGASYGRHGIVDASQCLPCDGSVGRCGALSRNSIYSLSLRAVDKLVPPELARNDVLASFLSPSWQFSVPFSIELGPCVSIDVRCCCCCCSPSLRML
jgi:hypothetical protein